tara:strand:+ start:239 stop:1129 length:891 start_codon:yes stop_codon:yes gene_type:complete
MTRKYTIINLKNKISNKILFITNKFFYFLAHTRGAKHKVLLFISIIFKIPLIIFYFMQRVLLIIKNIHMNTKELNIFKELNQYGYSYSDKIKISNNLLKKLNDSFYNKYQDKVIDNKQLRFPIEYLPIDQDLEKYICETIDNQLTSVISNYLFHMPYRKKVCYMYSRNTETISNSSQYWHLDRTGPKTLKIFITLHQTNHSHGLLKFIDSKISKIIEVNYKYTKSGLLKRLSDEDIEKVIKDNNDFEIINFEGEKGNVLCLDTEKCFHFGSRKATNRRLLILIEYGSLLDYKLPRF